MKTKKSLPCVIDYFSDIEIMKQTYHKLSSLNQTFWLRISDEELSNKFLDEVDHNELLIDSIDAKFDDLILSENYKRKLNIAQHYNTYLKEFHETYLFSEDDISFKNWFLERYEK